MQNSRGQHVVDFVRRNEENGRYPGNRSRGQGMSQCPFEQNGVPRRDCFGITVKLDGPWTAVPCVKGNTGRRAQSALQPYGGGKNPAG